MTNEDDVLAPDDVLTTDRAEQSGFTIELEQSGDDDTLALWHQEIARKHGNEVNAADVAAKLEQPHGGDRRSESFKDDTEKSDIHVDRPSGTSAAAAHRRLRKDRPDITRRPGTREENGG